MLSERIEAMRVKLHEMINEKPKLTDEEILKYSRQLDKLIEEYLKADKIKKIMDFKQN